MKKVTITGWGRSGSWAIRAEQLGTAIGAKIDWRIQRLEDADLVVYVKRVNDGLLNLIRQSGRPWVWDIVDAWPSPMDNQWDRTYSVSWLRGELRRVKPDAIVVSTTTMLNDSGWTGKSLVLPHHAWSRYQPRPLRSKVGVVGYEGAVAYLGFWEQGLKEECARRGWIFSVGNLSTVDVGIALRKNGSYPNQFWKSNCKLANIQALGIPAVCSPEEGYREFGSGRELIVENQKQLSLSFDKLESLNERIAIREAMLLAAPLLERVAREYSEWLQQNF
jgi:hypothetical protein